MGIRSTGLGRRLGGAWLLSLVCAAAAVAGDLRAPFDFETTAVLPKGVRNPRFKNLITFMDTKIGGSGGYEPLGYKLNKTVTWRDVVDAQTDPTLKAITQGKVASLGYSMDGAAGTTEGIVNTYANIKVPVLALGVTPKLTMAVAVPVIDVDVNADTGFAKTSEGQAFIDSIRQSDPDKAAEAASKLNNSVNSKLERLGYDRIESKHYSGVGDIKIVGKYRPEETYEDGFAFKGELTLPTGTPPNVNKALDIPMGDGQTDVGVAVLYDHFFDRHKALKVNAYAGYTAQLPDRIERRLPVSESETLSSDKEELERDLGDIITAGASLQYQFPFGLNLGAAYGFSHLDKARFEGSRFSDYRYRLLEANTRQVLHAMMLGMGFSSVEMYKEKRFVAPFQLNFAYSKPIRGMNVVSNELYAFEVVLFF